MRHVWSHPSYWVYRVKITTIWLLNGDQANNADSVYPISINDYIGDFVFQSTSGTPPEHAWPHLNKVTGSIHCFHGCLTTCKEPRQSLHLFQKYWQFDNTQLKWGVEKGCIRNEWVNAVIKTIFLPIPLASWCSNDKRGLIR